MFATTDSAGGGPGPSPFRAAHVPPPAATVFRHRFTASDSETRATLQALLPALTRAGVDAEECSTLELILAEVLNNVVEHAYANDPGPVDLCVSVQSAGVRCTILDRGRPMPQGAVPSPGLPPIEPPDFLPEGGFGWHIVRCLTSELGYTREADHNRLTLLMPWSGID